MKSKSRSSPRRTGELERLRRQVKALQTRNHRLTAALAQQRQAQSKADDGGRILDALMESVPVGITIADAPNVKIRKVSRMGREMLGNPQQGLTVSRIVSQLRSYRTDGVTPLPARELPLVRTIRTGETIRDFEFIQTNVRGERLHLACNAAPIRDASGRVSGGVVVWQDTADQKRAEDALRASEARLAQCIRVARLGWFEHDHDADTIYYSPFMREVGGWNATEPIDLPTIIARVHPQDRPAFASAVKRSHDPAGDGLFSTEHRVLLPDGTVRWVSVRGQTVFQGRGKARRPMRTIGALLDITERKHGEEQLKHVLRNARSIVMRANVTAPKGWDRQPIEWSAGKFQWKLALDDEVTARAVLPMKQASGETYLAAWKRNRHPDDRVPMDMNSARAFLTGASTYTNEYRCADKHGRWRHFLETAAIQPAGYGHWNVVLFDTDITERKEAEIALRNARDELEQRVAERTAELARTHAALEAQLAERATLREQIVAASELERERIGQDLHDGLCQMLAGLRFKMESLAGRLTGTSPVDGMAAESVAELLDQAIEEARSLARGLRPLADVPEALTFALRQLAKSSERLFGIQCECDIQRTILVPDHEAATHLLRIAQEAINNAVKHGKTRTVNIHVARKAGALVLVVRNDGKPFPRRPRATGMGLKTMRYRAERIGATLELKRGSRNGTTVRCVYPLRRR